MTKKKPLAPATLNRQFKVSKTWADSSMKNALKKLFLIIDRFNKSFKTRKD